VKEPRWLNATMILAIHTSQIQEHGGSLGLRDKGLLDSALDRPKNRFHHEAEADLLDRAASYGFGLARNHPFVDGNKRVALASCITLRMNGWNIIASEDAAYDTVLEVAQASKSKVEVAEWLLRNSKARMRLELRDFFHRLEYGTLEEIFESIAAGITPEQVATIIEAGNAIPAIAQANIGAVAAEEASDVQSARALRQHAMLLTAIYRIAEDMGYEW
jgi:death on curing protein